MVLTQDDYDRFEKKRRYISAKMMTYFAEYPVFIVGDGLNDANVTAIITDLGEAMRDKGGMLGNVYYIEWVPDVLSETALKEEHVVPASLGVDPLRVRTIVTTEFDWIFNVLADCAPPIKVNPKVLRHLASKVVEIVRTDAPKMTVELNYERIEGLTKNTGDLALLLGIGDGRNPNETHPYILSQVANLLGFSYWYKADVLLKEASAQLGKDIKKSDNNYHLAIKSGNTKPH